MLVGAVLYLRVKAYLADVTRDDGPLGFHQWNAEGMVDHRLLHWVHLCEREREREREDNHETGKLCIATVHPCLVQ